MDLTNVNLTLVSCYTKKVIVFTMRSWCQVFSLTENLKSTAPAHFIFEKMELHDGLLAKQKTLLTQNLRPIAGDALDRSRRVWWRGSTTVTDVVRRSTDDEVPLQVGHKVSHSSPRHVRCRCQLVMVLFCLHTGWPNGNCCLTDVNFGDGFVWRVKLRKVLAEGDTQEVASAE